MNTLEDRLRELMAETGWSIGEIAKRADVSSSAVSQWLNGQTASIRIEPAIKLQQGSGFNALWLAKGKGPKKTGTAIEAEPEFAGTARPYRRVPVVGTAKMGDDGFYDELSSMPGAGDGHIEIATEDPNAYCLRVRGQSMFPAIRDGWYVLIEPNGTPSEGEYVLIRLKDGRKMVKEFMYRRRGTIELMSVNGQERISIELADLDEERGMQAVGAVVSPSKWRPE